MRHSTAFDDPGREPLLLAHPGVRLIVKGAWVKGIVEEITAETGRSTTWGFAETRASREINVQEAGEATDEN